ncbi:MAG: phosphatidylglycerol lysyltransferase domain-containing protein [Oscillospiraceae bacterium]|nr:phosphatidylglycerol lysyltransferase domain-containing protein [Oscillospiraceae bacterium]
MLDFKKITLDDKEWVDKLLKQSDFMGSEYCFANMMAWSRYSDSKICRYKDFVITVSEKHGLVFTFPAGSGDYSDVLSQMQEYALCKGQELVIWNADDRRIKVIRETFSDDNIHIKQDEGQYDYIYLAEDLAEYKGRKYHSKKNHTNNFRKYNWSFENITYDNIDDCISFCTDDYNLNHRYASESGVAEQFAIHTYFMNYADLGLCGGILRVDKDIAAISIGEKVNSDTLVVHIEKASPEFTGSYPAMCTEFVRHFSDGCRYINREEDMGIEGLRKSKRSYNPVMMLKKDIVTINSKK